MVDLSGYAKFLDPFFMDRVSFFERKPVAKGDGTTEAKEEMTGENVPCYLDFQRPVVPQPQFLNQQILSTYVLYTPPNVEIQPGSRAKVTTSTGAVYDFVVVGEGHSYPTHWEYALERKEAAL